MEKETEEKYFKAKETTLYLSECDKDMLQYALSNVDFSDYSDEDFGGEDFLACIDHFIDILNQIDREIE